MVQSGFTRKKVESLTLGEKLRKLRNDFRMSLQDVSKATRIQVKYLEFLENGEYSKLPADVYVRGFLRSYARYLNVDEQALIKLYERECNIRENLGQETTKKPSSYESTPASFVITSRSLIMTLIVLLVGGSFLYLYREFKSFAAEPLLVVLAPENGAVIEGNEVTVSGKTDKGAELTINGQVVYVGDDGSFGDKLVLQPGVNAITLRTMNRFQKEKTAMLSVEARYTPVSPAPEVAENTETETFRLEVTARERALLLTVKTDGEMVFSGTLPLHETKIFEAKESIAITSDHGEQTFVRMNATGEPTLLSVEPGKTKEILFHKEGKQP
jgi:cytoskeletal protein RodZ